MINEEWWETALKQGSVEESQSQLVTKKLMSLVNDSLGSPDQSVDLIKYAMQVFVALLKHEDQDFSKLF